MGQKLLGKVLCHRVNSVWLCSRIIETEAYLISEKGSHSSLGFTEKRRALFMPPGTIYMYYARGNDSFNTSCKGEGNALLFKSGYPFFVNEANERIKMQGLNPKNGNARTDAELCSGQTLLCKSLGLKVTEWNGKPYKTGKLELRDYGIVPSKIIHAKRLGIPEGRDQHLFLRYIDFDFHQFCTQSPLKKTNKETLDYFISNGTSRVHF